MFASRHVEKSVIYRWLIFLFLCAFAPMATTAEPAYLRHEQLTILMDGRKAQTALPLDPARRYDVIISSRHTLRPLLDGSCQEQRRYLIFPSRSCAIPVRLNGVILPSSTNRTDDRIGSYFFDREESTYYVPSLTFFFWGDGQRLTISTDRDVSRQIPTATVEIIDRMYEKEQQHRALEEAARREAERQAIAQAALREQRAAEEAARLVQRMKRHDEIQDQLEVRRAQFALLQPQYLQEQKRAARWEPVRHIFQSIIATTVHALTISLYAMEQTFWFIIAVAVDVLTIVLYIALAAAAVFLLILFALWWVRIAPSLHKRREARRYGRQLAIEERREEEAKRQARQRRAEAEARARTEDEYRERVEADARERERETIRAYENLLNQLSLEYGDRAHFDDDAWLEQYVAKHGEEILKKQQRILSAHRTLHSDAGYVSYVQSHAPALYRRATWEMRALAKAEALEPGRKTQPLTAAERQAKVEDFRTRMLAKKRVQAEDRIATIRQNLELINQFDRELDHYDVDPDERERLRQDITDRLFGDDDEAVGGNFKQV